MKKTLKKLLSLVLVVVTIFSVSAFMPATALAANYTTNYKNYTQPSGPDFAYWNGKRMVKHKGTYKSNVQWMQASLNYCIKYKGLRASYLDVDGSFGPASKKTTLAFQKKYGLKQDGSFGPGTITKMKSVLSSSSKPTPKPTPNYGGKISTSAIQKVLDRYGYKSGTYWTVPSSKSYSGYTLCASSSSGSTYMASKYPAGTKASGGKTYMSYNYDNKWQCMGFAHFVMANVTGTNPAKLTNGWKKYTSVSRLQVGDIVRTGGHSSIVLSVDSNGNAKFAECWGNQKYGCLIKIGVGFNGSSCTTYSSINKKYTVKYIYRYVG